MYTLIASDTLCYVENFSTPCKSGLMKWYERGKLIMKAKGVKQKHLLSVFDVDTAGAVGHYLNGRRNPSIEQITQFAEAIDCSLDELMGRIDEKEADVRRAVRSVKAAINQSGREFSQVETDRIYRAVADKALQGEGDIEDFVRKMVEIA